MRMLGEWWPRISGGSVPCCPPPPLLTCFTTTLVPKIRDAQVNKTIHVKKSLVLVPPEIAFQNGVHIT